MNRVYLVGVIAAVVLSACTKSVPVDTLDIISMSMPASAPAAEPYLFTSEDGDVFLSWVERQEDKHELLISQLKDTVWSDPLVVASGANWFVNWADYPMIATNSGAMMAHYLAKSGQSTYAYDVNLTFSSDAGHTWDTARVLHDDGMQAEHGFVSILPYGENFFVAWLDGRNTVMEGHEDHVGQMTLRAAIVTTSGQKLNEWELDDRTCDCCQTTAAITSNGPIVIYRDRSDDEIRDMSIVRYVDGQWTAPKSIHDDNWKIKGCPVNGPRADAKGNEVVVAWFAAPESAARINVAFSHDGGETFDKPVRIDEGHGIGRVDVALLEDGNAMVSWMEGTSIMAARVGLDGRQSLSTIAESTDARSSGFPQMTRAGNRVIFAWTDDKTKSIRTASATL